LIVHGKEYKKTELRSIVRKIVEKSEGYSLEDQDFHFMLGVFEHHSEWDEKQGEGVIDISVRRSTGYRSKSCGFWLYRTDDSEIDISWTHCLRAKGYSESDKVRDVTAAAREEIRYQIDNFKDVNNIRGGMEIDHTPPFSFIFHSWMSREGQPDIELEDQGQYTFFKNRDVAKSWQDYHEEKATLKALSPGDNREKGGLVQGKVCHCGGDMKVFTQPKRDGTDFFPWRCFDCGTYGKSMKKLEVDAIASRVGRRPPKFNRRFDV